MTKDSASVQTYRLNSKAEASCTPAFAMPALLLILILLAADVSGQSQTPRASSQPGGRVLPGQSEATIGDSGYSVTIPEFKMNRIVGPRRQQEPGPPVKEEEPEPTHVAPTEAEEPAPREVIPARKQEEPPAEETEVGEPSETRPPKRLPFSPDGRQHPVAPLGTPVYEEPPRIGPPPEDEAKEDQSPVLKPPKAPEDIARDLPPPRKELLTGKPFPAVPLLEEQPEKSTPRNIAVEHHEYREEADRKEAIALDARRDPEMIPPLEPEPEAVALQEVPTRMEPAEGPDDLRLEQPEPKESIPSVELSALPPREPIVSPLDGSAIHSREVLTYLRETAPVLEELSVLMTRAPSLAIADYDPSDSNAAVVPKEVTLKMDSLKRELQILDSKTFAIIPPAKYAEFHSLIRKSIAETYQACDAILSFINESSPADLKKADEHIFRAREFIQRTREASSHG